MVVLCCRVFRQHPRNLSSGGCSSCGGAASEIDSSQENLSNQLYRAWLPTERTEIGSFGPGIFSQFDSKLQVSSGSNGNSIVFLNIVAGQSFYFVDGLDGDTQDGVFQDLRNKSAREIRMVNSSGATVTSPSAATEMIVTHWSGAKEKFQTIDLDPDTQATAYAGRLQKRIDRAGRELTVAYKSWTQAEIDASPSRQWQIDTVVDSFSNQLSFTYDTAQHGGRWCVTNVVRDDGPAVSFTYDADAMTSVQFADGSQSTYAYSQNTQNDTTMVTVVDDSTQSCDTCSAPEEVQTSDAGITMLANHYTLGYEDQNTVGIRIPGRRLQRSNSAGEVIWKNILPVNASTDRMMVISGGTAKVYYGDGSVQIISSYAESLGGGGGGVGGGGGPEARRQQKSRSRYVSANVVLVFQDYEINLEPAVYGATATLVQLQQGMVPSTTGLNGVQKTYEYDADKNRTKVSYTADGTFEKYAYNSFGQVTRKRTRNGEVVLTSYDSRGLKTSVEVGLIEVNNADVQTAAYAKTTYEYYPTGHASAGLLKYEMGPLYNSSNPTLYRTDYEYNAKGLVTKITETPDTANGARPVTLFSYNSKNQLISTTNPEGHVTTFAYDNMGRMTTTTYPDGSTEQTLYGAPASGNAGRVFKPRIA